MNEALAAAIVADIKGANACVDIHAPDAYLQEVSQVRVEERFAKTLLPLAQFLNTQLVWVHGSTDPLRSTLAHTLNSKRTRTLVVEMGESLRITEDAGSWLTEGILRLVEHLGGWTGSSVALPSPRLVRGGSVTVVSSEVPGFFLPRIELGTTVRSGQIIGVIADPLEAKVKAEVVAPSEGTVISLRAQPLVYPGTLLARVLGGMR